MEPARNSTFVILAGNTGVAVAASATTDPAVTVEPVVGLVRTTLGAVTLTLIIGDVAVRPLESVTLAVSATIPDAVGVQDTE